MKTLTVTPANPVLGNFNPTILAPVKTKIGIFQVVWVGQIDNHALLFQESGKGSAYVLASHNNGFACHELLKSLKKENLDKVLKQVNFIKDCGGLAVSDKTFKYLVDLREKTIDGAERL